MHSICPRRPLPRLPHGFGARSGGLGPSVPPLELVGLSLNAPPPPGHWAAPAHSLVPAFQDKRSVQCPCRAHRAHVRPFGPAARPPGTPPHRAAHITSRCISLRSACVPHSRRTTPHQEARRPSLGRDIGCGVGTGSSGWQSTRRLSLEQVGEPADVRRASPAGPAAVSGCRSTIHSFISFY